VHFALTVSIFCVQGKVVPNFVNRYSKRRKVSIEVHKVTPTTTAAPTKKRAKKEEEVHSYEECVVRYVYSKYRLSPSFLRTKLILIIIFCFVLHSVLVPVDKHKAKEARKLGLAKVRRSKGSNAASKSEMQQLLEADGVSVGDDDESTAGAATTLADTGGKNFDGWNPRYRIPCQSIIIKHHTKKSVYVIVEVEKLKQERELLFDTVEEAQAFCDTLERERKKEVDRMEMRLKASLGGIKLPPMETLTLLVEIVSAWDIPVGDFTSSDPYVIALFGRREVHKTHVIYST
jgi:hypothetical protein